MASAWQPTRGTYNCPICGWNEPHSEHAGEQIHRLLEENQRIRQVVAGLAGVRREMEIHLQQPSFVDSNRVIPVYKVQSWLSRLSIDLDTQLREVTVPPVRRGEDQ